MIQKAVADKKWKPIKIGRKCPPISNLFFADDLIFFAEASKSQIDVIMECWNDFCAISGRVISPAKDKLFVSPNFHKLTAREISARCQIPLTADSLWAAVLKGKYLQNENLLECKATSNSSYTWRSILRGQELLKKGTKWIVGDGKTRKFWKDLWIGDQPLLACALGTIPAEEMDYQIWDYTDGRGSWNWESFSHWLPEDVIRCIRAIHISTEDSCPDTMSWKGSNNGKFHSKAAYDLLEEEAGCDEEAEWESLWKGKIPPKLKHFFWLARQDRLLTNQVRLTRHLTTDCSCKSCGFPVENCLHILRDCPMARPVWEQLIPHNLNQHFFGLNLKDWIDANLGGRVTPPTEAITWLSRFAQAAWALWSWRNNTLFETSFSRPPNPVQYIMLKARECEECIKV